MIQHLLSNQDRAVWAMRSFLPTEPYHVGNDEHWRGVCTTGAVTTPRKSSGLQVIAQQGGKRVGAHKASSQPVIDHRTGNDNARSVAGDDVNLQVRTRSIYDEESKLTDAIEALDSLVQQGAYIHSSSFHQLLKRCVAGKDLTLGRKVHALVVKSGYGSNAFLANHIICMYAAHGMLKEATQVFHRVDAPNLFVWASIILAHCRQGRTRDAIKLYKKMRQSDVKPDDCVFIAVLKACATANDLSSGKEVHADIGRTRSQDNVVVRNCIVDMYAKCGSLQDAIQAFDNQPEKDVVTWTALISGYVRQGYGQEALALYVKMQQEGAVQPNKVTYVCLLQACTSMEALSQGKQLHAQIKAKGMEADVVVGNCLINMYAKCGSLVNARNVFEKMIIKDVVTWNSMITGYAHHGLAQEALSLYAHMQKEGVTVDKVTFVCLLKACTSTKAAIQGKQLHAEVERRGWAADLVVGTCLVDMYSKYGSLEAARSVFDNLTTKNVVTWNAMITGYVDHGLGHEALNLYSLLRKEGTTEPDVLTFINLLQACATIADLLRGKQVHAQIRGIGMQADVVVGNSLIHMYTKCGSLADARMVFDNLPSRDVVTWNTMLSGYVQHGFGEESLTLYEIMQAEGRTPADSVTFVCLLQACSNVTRLERGENLHAEISKTGLDKTHVCVANALVDMYCKCGSLGTARELFDNLRIKDVVTWTVMITGYAQQGFAQEALALYASMQQSGSTTADAVTYTCLLQACTDLGALQKGRQLHAQILEQGLEADVVVSTCLVDMYAKCGSLTDARRVFDGMQSKTVVAWTSLIVGYTQQGLGHDALLLHRRMQQEGIIPTNAVAYACLLQACAEVGALDEGRLLHYQIQQTALDTDVVVGASLVDMYAKHGSLEDARRVFDDLPQKNVITWTALMAGYAIHGQSHEAFLIYERMRQEEDLTPTAVTFTCLLQACGHMAGLEKGRELHLEIASAGLEHTDLSVANALIDMYMKCGSLRDAQHVFDGLVIKDIVTWNAMISGYARHGQSDIVFDLFHRMEKEGIHPDGLTFLSILTACNHVGLVDTGLEYFDAMRRVYSIAPTAEHYNSLVDLLCRAGQLTKVMQILRTMPCEPDNVLWRCVLGGCRKW